MFRQRTLMDNMKIYNKRTLTFHKCKFIGLSIDIMNESFIASFFLDFNTDFRS